MDEQSAGDTSGLKAVRYDLERRGMVHRFYDACHRGGLEAVARLAGSGVERKQADPRATLEVNGMMWSRMRSAPLKSPFHWDPWHEIDELRRSFERIGERSVERALAGPAGVGFVPQVDLYDVGAAFIVRVDLPGVKEGGLEIIVGGSTLTIRGQREVDGRRDERYLYCERPIGHFARTIEVSESVDGDRVEATLKLGILEITLPKAETAVVKKRVVTLSKK